jgi:hypothetical protein
MEFEGYESCTRFWKHVFLFARYEHFSFTFIIQLITLNGITVINYALNLSRICSMEIINAWDSVTLSSNVLMITTICCRPPEALLANYIAEKSLTYTHTHAHIGFMDHGIHFNSILNFLLNCVYFMRHSVQWVCAHAHTHTHTYTHSHMP